MAMIEEVLKKAPKLSSIEAAIFMNEVYETKFGIHNHFNGPNRKPLDSVTLHRTEENGQTSALDEAFDVYISNGIKDVFGMSLSEYLSLPSEICKSLVEKAGAVTRKKTQLLSDLESKLPKPPVHK